MNAFSAKLQTHQYEPRDQDADHEAFEARLRSCEKCQWRFGHRCRVAQQLCSVLARLPGEACPVSRWGSLGESNPVLGMHSPLRPSSHVIPEPEGEPLVGPVWGDVPHRPFSGPIQRNLICHIFPLTAGQKWRRTVRHLGARRQLFNGERIVSVAQSHACDSTREVENAFAEVGLPVDILEFENRSELGEVVSFSQMLSRVCDPIPGLDQANRTTFYCHGKGATWPESSAAAHEWADAMFAVCLDRWELVERALGTAAICGPFRRRTALAGSISSWHFSGTFFWLRHHSLPREFSEVENVWSGVEGWPGLHFEHHSAACLFLDDVRDLYDLDYWDKTVRPALRRWRELQPGQTPTSKEPPPCL